MNRQRNLVESRPAAFAEEVAAAEALREEVMRSVIEACRSRCEKEGIDFDARKLEALWREKLKTEQTTSPI